MRLDEVLSKLARTRAELESLPEDAFDERSRKRERLAELRAEAGRLRDEYPTARAELEAELKGLKRQLKRVLEDRPNPAGMSDSGQGGYDVAYAQNIAWAVDEAMGRDQIEKRIRAIQTRLEQGDY